mgnify:FL=1
MNADQIIADCQQKSNEYLAPEFKNFYHIGQLQHHIIELCQEIDILKDHIKDMTTTIESIEL